MPTKIVGYTTKVIGNKIEIRDSEGESVLSDDLLTLLQFLNETYTDSHYFAIKVFFDLDEHLAPLLRLLGTAGCKQLASPEHTLQINDKLSLFYIPNKIFAIHWKQFDIESREEKVFSSYFYHLAQYYIDDDDPHDPVTTAAMAENVMEAFRAMGLHPKKLTSPVAIYESEVLSHMSIPNIANIPGKHEELIEYAENCMGRPEFMRKGHAWIQSYQVGHFGVGDIWEYDLKSAHPSVAMKLRSLQHAKFAKSYSMLEDADWAFMLGRVTIPNDVNISPVFYFAPNGEIYQPTGTWPCWMPLQIYNCINRWGIGSFKMHSGYFIKFTAPVYPMETTIKRLFNQRGQGGLINANAKLISTGIAGKFAELHDDGTPGPHYNPIYREMIEDMTNVMITDFIYENELQDDVVAIGVDSVSSTKEATKIKDQSRVSLGDWRLTGIGPTLVLSPGRVYHKDKKPHGLNYQQILDLIDEHPRSSYYTAKMRRRQTLAESIQLGNLANLGKYKDTSSSFDLNMIRTGIKREFDDFPYTGEQLLNHVYKSKPLHVEIDDDYEEFY